MIPRRRRQSRRPTGKKAQELENLLEAVSGRTTAITSDRCVDSPLGCSESVGKFKDTLSVQEYRISGLCQACQDSVFSG